MLVQPFVFNREWVQLRHIDFSSAFKMLDVHTKNKPPLGADQYYWCRQEETRLFDDDLLKFEESVALCDFGEKAFYLFIPFYRAAMCYPEALLRFVVNEFSNFGGREMHLFTRRIIRASKEAREQNSGYAVFLRSIAKAYEEHFHEKFYNLGSIDEEYYDYLFDFAEYDLDPLREKQAYKTAVMTLLILTEQMKQESLNNG